jgi:hypothetical protein
MTFIGQILPWCITKRFVKQIAASNQFEIGGEHLSAISLDDAFYLIDLPTNGLRRILLTLNYLLPTFLVLGHRSRFEFTISSPETKGTRQLHAWHIDPSSILVEYFNPQELAVKQAEWTASRASLASAPNHPDWDEWPSATDKERLAEQERIRVANQRAAADRAASALRASR